MHRAVISELDSWKDSPHRKPLILRGARQVGKTWIMKEFGRLRYRDAAYFNFDENRDLASIFASDKDPERICALLSVILGRKIVKGETLIIFDEVQECPDALNSLKYFQENAPEHHVIAAGSLLGTLLASPKSYPVGKVTLLDVAPLSFGEFLAEADPVLEEYRSSISAGDTVEEVFHQKLLEMFRLYMITGGMPEAVLAWTVDHDPGLVRKVHADLAALYENDFSKHGGRINSGRLLMVFRSIPSQLAKENEKFMYGAVKPGGRARDFEEAIEWLVSAGMLNRLFNVSKPEHPLPVFDRQDCFKLYMFDTGLLKSMSGVDDSAIIMNADFQFKGQLAENYVLQQIRSLGQTAPRYYSDRSGEIDFLVQLQGNVIPVEVKAGQKKSAPSFKRFIEHYEPEAAIRFSSMGFRKDGAVTNIPLYLADRFTELL